MASKLNKNVGGFGHAVVEAELHFVIERNRDSAHGGTRDFRVHVFHGVPASATWFTTGFHRVASVHSLARAKEMLDTIAGVADAWKAFDLVELVGNIGSANYERTPMATLPPDAQ